MPTSLLHSQFDTTEALTAKELEHGSTVVSVEGTPGPRALHERARPLRPSPISRKVTAHESHRHLDQRLVCCPALR